MKRRRCISAIRSYETVAYWHLPNKGQNQWDKQDQRGCESVCACVVMCGVQRNFCGAGMYVCNVASVAQLGERQTEDLKVLGSIPSRGSLCISCCCQDTFVVVRPLLASQCIAAAVCTIIEHFAGGLDHWNVSSYMQEDYSIIDRDVVGLTVHLNAFVMV